MASLGGSGRRLKRRELIFGDPNQHANPLLGATSATDLIRLKEGEWRVRGGWAVNGNLDNPEDATRLAVYRDQVFGIGPHYIQNALGQQDHVPEFNVISGYGITAGAGATVLNTDVCYFNNKLFQAAAVRRAGNNVEIRVSEYRVTEEGLSPLIHEYLLATGNTSTFHSVQIVARANQGVTVIWDNSTSIYVSTFTTLEDVAITTQEILTDYVGGSSARFYVTSNDDFFFVCYTRDATPDTLRVSAWSGDIDSADLTEEWTADVDTAFTQIDAISAVVDATNVWIVWNDHTGTDADTFYVAKRNAAAGTQTIVATAFDNLLGQSTRIEEGEISIVVQSDGTAIVAWSEVPDLAESALYVPELKVHHISGAGVSQSERYIHRARLASQLFAYDDRVFVYILVEDYSEVSTRNGINVVADTDPDVGTAPTLPQHHYCLMDLRIGVADAAEDDAAASARLVAILGYDQGWYRLSESPPSKVATGDALFPWLVSLPWLRLPYIPAGAVGINDIDTYIYGLRVNDPARWQSIDLGGVLCFAGGLPSYFSGGELHEFGFAQTPEILSVVQSGGTAVAESNLTQQAFPTATPVQSTLPPVANIPIVQPTTSGGAAKASQTQNINGQGIVGTGFRYSFTARYVAYDNDGNQYYSAFANPVTIFSDTSLASATAVLTISTLNHTNRQDYENGYKDNVGIEVYRTTLVTDEAGQTLQSTIFQRFRVVANDPREAWVTVTTSTLETDAWVQMQPIANFESGELQPTPPPPARWPLARHNRMCLIGTPDGRGFWWSKPYLQGRGLQFTDTFQLRVDDDAGRLTGAQIHNGRLLGFAKNKFFYLDGSFPDDTGAGSSLGELTLITSTTGCEGSQWTAHTEFGLIYLAAGNKWYLLDHSGKDQYIGKEVEDTMASFPEVQSVWKERGTHFVFMALQNAAGTAGTIIRFDLLHGCWSTDTLTNIIPQSFGQTSAGLYLLDADADLRLETVGAGDAATDDYLTGIWDSGWAAPAGFNGWHAAQEFFCLFQPRAFAAGQSVVAITRKINFIDTVVQTHTYNTATGQSGQGHNVRVTPNPTQAHAERWLVSVTQVLGTTQSAEPARLTGMRLVYEPLSETLLPDAKKGF